MADNLAKKAHSAWHFTQSTTERADFDCGHSEQAQGPILQVDIESLFS